MTDFVLASLTALWIVTAHMLANSICCCLPVHRTIMPNIPIVKKVRSKIYLLYAGRNNRSGGSNILPPSTITTIGGNVKKRGGSDPEWLELNKPSPLGISWADVESTAEVEAGTGVRPSLSSQSMGQQGRSAVHVQRTFEVI